MLLVVEITHFVYYISSVGAMYRGLLESPILLSYPLTEQQGRQESGGKNESAQCAIVTHSNMMFDTYMSLVKLRISIPGPSHVTSHIRLSTTVLLFLSVDTKSVGDMLASFPGTARTRLLLIPISASRSSAGLMASW